ncbi:MAG: transporter [Nitrospirota bacterium]
MLKKMVVALAMVFSTTTLTYAAHPLITDDTGTMGKGKFQVEVNSEFSYDKEKEDGITTKERMSELSTILSYGIVDNVDVVLVVPYQWIRTKEDGVTTSVDGISDISLEVKWRFYEKDGLGFALKPGTTLPTGDDEDGLGTGRATSSLFFISTKELEPWAFHLNLGYIRNENKADERKDLWHASIASEVEVIKNLRAVANIGIERNGDKASNDHPAFVLGGVIYSINENLDIDVGIKGALNKPETDYTFLAGMAWRF